MVDDPTSTSMPMQRLGDAAGWGCYQSTPPSGPWFWYAYSPSGREEGEEDIQGMAELRAKQAYRRLRDRPVPMTFRVTAEAPSTPTGVITDIDVPSTPTTQSMGMKPGWSARHASPFSDVGSPGEDLSDGEDGFGLEALGDVDDYDPMDG